jgi:ribosomal protein L7Ae-like RNA K-turn-binding protein
MRDSYNTLLRQSQGKKLLGRSKNRCANNIKSGIRETCNEVVDRIKQAVPIAGSCEQGNGHFDSIKS